MSQAEYKKRLKVLMSKPENQVCSDCPERQPRWASLIVPPPGSPPGMQPMGAFCCLECSGSHRRLGTHISFVRSVNLDSWKEKEVLAMENGGNKKVNAIFEAFLNSPKPSTTADGRTRERYIRDKYERRKFFSPKVLMSINNGELEESSEEDSSEEEKKTKRVTSKASKATSRTPSEAARRRAESRKARVNSTLSESNRTEKKVIKKVIFPNRPVVETKTPAPAAPPIDTKVADLLDFSADFTTPMSNPDPLPDPPSLSPSLSSSPKLDLFKGMSVSNSIGVIPNSDSVSDNAAQSASAMGQKRLNNDEILSLFNQPQPSTQMGFGMGGGIGAAMSMPMGNGNMNMMTMNPNMVPMNGNMMGANNIMGMMPQQSATNMNMNMSAFAAQQSQQQRNMMMLMQQNGMNNAMNGGMMAQQNFPNVMNQTNANSGMGNMQQHIAMMNNMQINNTGMMMQGGARGSHTSKVQGANDQQQATVEIMGGTSQGENAGMRGFGM